MERFRLNTPYQMRLNTLSTPFAQQSRLDPNTQMRVVTDPLLNMSYRRQFEDYQQNIFTETLGRVEGATIGAAIGFAAGAIASSIVSLLVPGDFGTIAVAGTTISLKAASAAAGAVGGAIGSDYTTHHATMDIINNTIIASFKQSPAMGVLNSLAFTGKSMDLLMGGEAIRATISAAITGNDMFENISRAYGTHEDGRTEYDFSVIREQMGLDLGAFGNTVFDITGEIVTDPGAWGGITGKVLTFAKGNKAAMEAMTVVKASKELSEVVVKKPKLAKEIARVIRLDDIDGLRRIVAHNTNTLGEGISDEVLQKFMKEVNASASKSTAYRLNKMFQEWDKTDDFLTAAIFKSTTPFGGWTVLKKGKDLFNQKILSNFIEDSKIARILYKAGDIIFGNKYRHNFIKQGGEDFLKYINEKYSVYKSGKQYKSMLNDFINGIKEGDELYPLVKQMKDADEDLYTLLSDARFEKVKTKFVEQINTLTGTEQIAVAGIVSRIEQIDDKMHELTKDKSFLFLTGDAKSEYTKLFMERQRLTKQFSKHEKNLVGLEYQQRKLNMTEKDRQFKKIINDIKKFSRLDRELIESEKKALADSITALKELLKSSEGEKFIDDLEKMSYYKNDNFIKFLRDNTDDAIKKEFDEAFKTSKKNYEDTITKYSPKYRKKVLKAEETRINKRIKELSNKNKLSEEELQELADIRGLKDEIDKIKSDVALKEEEIFNKAFSKINEHKFKYTEASFIEPAKTEGAIKMEQEVSELGDLYKKNLRIKNLFLNTSIKYEPKAFGVQKIYRTSDPSFYAKGQEAVKIMMDNFSDIFNELSELPGLSDSDKQAIRDVMDLISFSIGKFLEVPSWLARTNRALNYTNAFINKYITEGKLTDPLIKEKYDGLVNTVRAKLTRQINLNKSFDLDKFDIDKVIPDSSFITEELRDEIISKLGADHIVSQELLKIKLAPKGTLSEDVLGSYIDIATFKSARNLRDVKLNIMFTVLEEEDVSIKTTIDSLQKYISSSIKELKGKYKLAELSKETLEKIKFLEEANKKLDEVNNIMIHGVQKTQADLDIEAIDKRIAELDDFLHNYTQHSKYFSDARTEIRMHYLKLKEYKHRFKKTYSSFDKAMYLEYLDKYKNSIQKYQDILDPYYNTKTLIEEAKAELQELKKGLEKTVTFNKQKAVKNIIDELKQKQFKWLIESYESSIKHAKKPVNDLLDAADKTLSSKKKTLFRWLKAHNVSDASLKKINEITDIELFFEEIKKHLPYEFQETKEYRELVSEYVHFHKVSLSYTQTLNKISSTETTLKQLYLAAERSSGIDPTALVDMMFDELTTSSMFGSLNSIIYVLGKDQKLDDDVTTFITDRLSVFSSRLITMRVLFGNKGDIYKHLIESLYKINNFINSCMLNGTLTQSIDQLQDMYNTVRKLKAQTNRIKMLGSLNINLSYSFDKKTGLYKLKSKKGSTKAYDDLLSRIFKLSEDDMTGYKSLTNRLGYRSLKEIRVILNDPELKVDENEIKILKDLLLTDRNIIGEQLRKQAWEWKDYTANIGNNDVIKHYRKDINLEEFKNKKLSQFKFVYIDTETYSKTNGVWSISYSVVQYDEKGTPKIIKQNTMYINDSVLDADFADKTLKQEDLADELNAKILEKDFRIKTDSNVGATIRLRDEHIKQARKKARRERKRFKTYNYDLAFKELDGILQDKDSLFVAQNANFDIKQLLNARAKSLGQSALYTDNLSMNMLDLNDGFAKAKLDWNVVDLLALNKKFNIFDKSQGTTNVAMGMQTLNVKREYYSETGDLLEVAQTNAKRETPNTITVQYKPDGIYYFYNGKSLHEADIDVAVMKEWSDVAIRTLMDKGFTLGSIMESSFKSLADDTLETHKVKITKHKATSRKSFSYTKRTYFYNDPKTKRTYFFQTKSNDTPIYEEILDEKGNVVGKNILDVDLYNDSQVKPAYFSDVSFSEVVGNGESYTEEISFNEFFRLSIEDLLNRITLEGGFYDPNLSHLFTGEDGLLNLLENTSDAVKNGQGDFKSVSDFIEQLKEIVERYNYRHRVKIDRMDYHYNYAEAREAIRPEDEEIVDKLNEIINAFTNLNHEVESSILLNHRMLAGDNIMYRQVNRVVVSQDLAYLSINNPSFELLEKILLGGEIEDDPSGKYLMLQAIFNPEKFSQIPERWVDVLKKYANHPKIQALKESIDEVRKNFEWYTGVLKELEEFGDDKGHYLDAMHRCISDIEYKFKHQLPAKTPEQAKEQQEELLRFIKNRFRSIKIVGFNGRNIIFGSRIREVFDRIEKRYIDAVSNGKTPYLTPDSKFTNDFFNKFQEDVIYVFRDSFDNAHVKNEDLRKGFVLDDPIQTMESLLRDSIQPYRDYLRNVKLRNQQYKLDPLSFHEVNNQLRQELTFEKKTIFREIRPNMLPGMSSVTLVYAEETKRSMQLKARVNSIFAELFKPMDEERLYDPTTLPLVNAEGHTLTRMLEQVSNSLGVDIEMVLDHLEFSDITMDDKLTILQASLLNKIYEGNFTEVFNKKFINQLSEEQLELMRQTAYKILHISEDDFKAIDKTKLEQLKFVFAEALLGVKAMDFERNAEEITDELREQFSVYKKMHEEIDTTSDVWKQVKKFFKNQDGSYDLEGLRNYFRNNKSERLVYIDPVDNKLRLLNTDNPATLKQAIDSNAEIGIMSIDAYTKYTSKNQLRELPWKWMRVLRSTVLRATKYFSLAFSIPFVVTNAAAAVMQDLSSMEGGFDIIRFGKAFGETWKMHKMWSKIDHTFGTTLVNSVYRRMSKSNDWADFIGQSYYLETLKPIEEGLQKYIGKSPEEVIKMLETEDNKFLRQLLRRKKPDDIVDEMNIIKETIEEFNKLDDKTKTKLLEFNTYMNTASVSGFSAEFSNRELIKEKQAETLDYFKKTGDGRYYIYKDTPNSSDDIKTKFFEKNSNIEVPEMKSLEDEYNFLEKNKSNLSSYGYRRLKQLDDEIENGYSEWMTNILNKIPKGGLLDFNGSMEEIFRVTMIKTLIDEGMSLDEATAEVISRHFVYMDKSVGEQMMEFIFPFLSYSVRSFDLFNNLAGDASFMEMMYLWDKYSWGSAEEQRKKSDYLTSKKVKGAIPVGDSLLNIGNAFTETANLMADPIKGWGNKLNPAIRVATGMAPVTHLPLVSQGANLVQGIQDMSTGNYTPGQITGLANSFYRNSQYFYNKQPFTTKVKPFYNNLYTSGGFSRIAMNMQPTTLTNVQYRVGNILYKRSIM